MPRLFKGFFIILLLSLDIFSKDYCMQHPMTLIEIGPCGILFRAAKNTGMSWGLAGGWNDAIAWVSIFLVAWSLWKTFEKNSSMVWVLLSAGGIGNMIDRFFFAGVRDFIALAYHREIFFPIFNIADIYLTVAVFLLIYQDYAYSFSMPALQKQSHES